MEPKSFSATAFQVAELCTARYKAEQIDRTQSFNKDAATLGSAVHGALEMYVKSVYLEKAEPANKQTLLDFFKLSYAKEFNTFDYATEAFMDGISLLEKWYKRTDVGDENVEVISCEVKTFFEIPTSLGPKPVNYIWDRFDQVGPLEYRVVDYKTNKWAITSSDLKKKIQARIYGLAAAIQLKREGKEYKRIWVQFDMLRHPEPVGIVFSREELETTWHYILESSKQIIDTPDDEVEERLNDQCLFCVRKAGCEALKKNVLVGGIHTLDTLEKAIDARAQIEWQQKGLNALLREIDKKILTEAKQKDIETAESDTVKMRIGVSRTRSIDGERVQHVIGDALFQKHGSTNITIKSVEELLKGKDLTDEQKAQLRSLIYFKTGQPSVKTETKSPIDED